MSMKRITVISFQIGVRPLTENSSFDVPPASRYNFHEIDLVFVIYKQQVTAKKNCSLNKKLHVFSSNMK